MLWELNHLLCRASGRVLLDGFQARFDFNGPVAVVGPSGAGKSISVQCGLGLFPFQSGSVAFHAPTGLLELDANSASNSWQRLRQQIMFVPQFPNLFDDFSVKSNLLFPFRQKKAARAVLQSEHFTSVLNQLDLKDMLNQLPTALTPGQRKRVAIGRALLQEPQVLLLDEPTTDLDPKARNQMIDALRQLTETKRGLGFITHDPELLASIPSDIKVIQNGQVDWEGHWDDYRQRPVTHQSLSGDF